jgi:hypothetical protein
MRSEASAIPADLRRDHAGRERVDDRLRSKGIFRGISIAMI